VVAPNQPWEEREPLSERTLPSVVAQTYERREAIVVGNAVQDDTEARIAALGDACIRFVNLPFRGPYPAAPGARLLIAGTPPANRGLAEARGRCIAPLDHDDAFVPGHIECCWPRRRARGPRSCTAGCAPWTRAATGFSDRSASGRLGSASSPGILALPSRPDTLSLRRAGPFRRRARRFESWPAVVGGGCAVRVPGSLGRRLLPRGAVGNAGYAARVAATASASTPRGVNAAAPAICRARFDARYASPGA
jgi:hypothetical protein